MLTRADAIGLTIIRFGPLTDAYISISETSTGRAKVLLHPIGASYTTDILTNSAGDQYVPNFFQAAALHVYLYDYRWSSLPLWAPSLMASINPGVAKVFSWGRPYVTGADVEMPIREIKHRWFSKGKHVPLLDALQILAGIKGPLAARSRGRSSA